MKVADLAHVRYNTAMRIAAINAQAWTLPLRAPFVIAQRTAYEARNVRILIRTEDSGLSGNGASAPVGYVTGESVESVLEALSAVGPEFIGLPIDRLSPLLTKANRLLADAPAARAGLEMAIYDLWAKRWNLPLWQHFGGAQDSLITDLTIPLVSPAEAATLAEAAWGEGFRTLKIKVGDAAGSDADLARIEAIAQAVPGIILRVDANQAFSPDQAVAFANALMEMNVASELLEQPVPKEDMVGLKYVRERVSAPVFADEAACSVLEVQNLLREDAVDGINVKLMKSGLWGALQIISLCRAAGKKLMLGCMLETGLGIAAAAQIAGGTGAFDFLDLDSHRLLAPVTGFSGGFSCSGDILAVGSSYKPGWGVTLPEIKC